MIGAEPHGRIDGIDVADALVQRIDRFVDHRQQDPVDDESGEVLGIGGRLAEPLDHIERGVERRVVGGDVPVVFRAFFAHLFGRQKRGVEGPGKAWAERTSFARPPARQRSRFPSSATPAWCRNCRSRRNSAHFGTSPKCRRIWQEVAAAVGIREPADHALAFG